MKTSALLLAAPITLTGSAPDRPNRSAARRDNNHQSSNRKDGGIGNVFLSLKLAKGEQLGEMAINGSGHGKGQEN